MLAVNHGLSEKPSTVEQSFLFGPFERSNVGLALQVLVTESFISPALCMCVEALHFCESMCARHHLSQVARICFRPWEALDSRLFSFNKTQEYGT